MLSYAQDFTHLSHSRLLNAEASLCSECLIKRGNSSSAFHHHQRVHLPIEIFMLGYPGMIPPPPTHTQVNQSFNHPH